MTETIENDIRNSIEAMFYTPNYCDLYIHINQVREQLGLDKVSLESIIEENKWVVEQFRKYIGSHQVTVLKEPDYLKMLDTVNGLIDKAEETTTSPKELLYMYLRDEWLSQLHAVISNAIEALDHINEEEDYDA